MAGDIPGKCVVGNVGNPWESSRAICQCTATVFIGIFQYILMVDYEYDNFFLMISINNEAHIKKKKSLDVLVF